MIPSALPGGSPATIAALRDVLGIELLQAALSTPYASQALGEAGTTTGQYFAVDAGGGTVSIYLRTGGGSTLKGTINVSGVAGGGGGGGGGTVTSIALSAGTGISLTGASPITSSGSWLLTLSVFLQSWSAIDPTTKSDVGHSHTFASLTSKPTTLAGYGIADAAALSHSHTFASLTSKPTTIAGYGITDAASLTSFSAANGSSLVGFQQAGTGASTRVLQEKARERLSLADFVTPAHLATAMARSAEIEISTAMTNAMAQLTAVGGGVLYIPAGSWKTTSTIVVDEPSIDIVGAGGDGNHDASSPETGTTIRWRGADGGIMFRVQSKGLAGSPTPSGGALRNLKLNGGATTNTMGVGVLVASVRGWVFENLTIINPTTHGMYIGVQTLGAEARDTQKCLFRHITVRCLTAVSISGVGFELAGGTDANASFNLFEHCDVLIQNGAGYKLVCADNNTFMQCRAFRPSGTGYSLEVHGGTPPNLPCSANTFYGFSPSAAGIKLFGTTTYTQPSAMTMFYAYDMANGSPMPTVETGATWYMHKTSGVSYNDYFVKPVLGIDDSAADAHRAARSNETLRIYNFSANHVRYADGTGNEWAVRLDGSGNFETLRIAGSGGIKLSSPTEFSSTIALASGNRLLLQGAGNLTGIRYQSSNIEMYVGASFAAGFGANTVGFNGTTPVAKPAVTGAKSGNAALASLLAALASMGLITDSST